MINPIQFTGSIRPAKLPENCNDIDPSEIVFAAGSGRTVHTVRSTDNRLRHGFLKVVSKKQCENYVNDDSLNLESIFCANSLDGHEVSGGDSGKYSKQD